MSTFPKALQGTQLPLEHPGSGQYPWAPCGDRQNVITNTTALFNIGLASILHPTTKPYTSCAMNGGIRDINLSDDDAMLVFKPNPTALLKLRFIAGRSGADPNNRMAQFAVVGWSEYRHSGNTPQWVGSVLYTGYAIAGDTQVPATSKVIPASFSGYEMNWCDTIGGTDYTLGDSAKVMHEYTDAAASLLLDFDSHALIGVFGTCLTDGSHGTAAGAFTAMFTQM